MRYVPVLVTALLVAAGVMAIVAGEADDSPGLQLVGVMLVAGAVVSAIRIVRRSARRG